MGTKGRSIIGIDVKKLITLLNKAFSDEWLAYYQYWIGSKVVKGPMKEAVIAELVQHSADELRHAEMLTTRIIQLGGTPPIRRETGISSLTADMTLRKTLLLSRCSSRILKANSAP
jgi:ferritin-like protein